jgi:uncharacterized protein (TIGR03437 family)
MRFSRVQETIRTAIVFLSVLTIAPTISVSEETQRSCGSHPDRLQAELQLHRKARQKRLSRGGGVGLQSATAAIERRPATSVRGDVVLMSETDGVVSRRNDFDLDNRTIVFAPTGADASGYRFSLEGASYDITAAAAGTPIEDFADDDSREMSIPFSFPYYGKTYSTVHINSDGNLTFESGDTETTTRSLDRLAAGPPRLAPLFRDLDPTASADGVRVLIESNRLVISWSEVPEFSRFGSGPAQTFQARLHADGKIEFAFTDITSESAVVGISPGNTIGVTRVISFVDESTEEFTGTVAERFTFTEELDIILAAQKFYEEHDDAYDYLVFYNNMGIDADIGTVAFEITIRNRRNGIGDPIGDFGDFVGSPNRLQALLNLGPLRQYPDDPNAIVSRRATAGDTPLTVLGHEAGHLFLAFASVRGETDPSATPMLGRDGAHWSFVFNSEASLLEGNRICDRQMSDSCPDDPQGTRRFVTVATVEGYSPLDQYLMGFRPPWEVPDTFVVEDPSLFNVSRMPQKNVNFSGRRRDIRIDDLIAAEGRRTPDHTLSQRRFRFAFVLVHEDGEPPSEDAFEKVDRYRREFEAFYAQAAGNRATAVTTVRRSLNLSLFPATGLLTGGTTTASITLQEPAAADLDVLLSADSGAAGLPASVRVPAGATSASFAVAGLRAGVDTIQAEIPGDVFEIAEARIQVSSVGPDLRLEVIAGDKQVVTPNQPLPDTIVVKVTDANDLTYPGVRLQAVPSGSGSVVPGEAVTNAEGLAEFRWTPDAGIANELTISLAESSGAPQVTVATTGEPWSSANGIVNAASFAEDLSPGSIASIFGANLAGGVEAAASLPLPNKLEGIEVLLNGSAVPLFYVSDRQINFLIPLGFETGVANLVVSTPLGETGSLPVVVNEFSPAVFVIPSTGEGAVLVAGTSNLTSEQPVGPGDFVEVYCTGLGGVQRSTSGGSLETVATPQVTIGGMAADVQWSGLAPGFVGLYQVNINIGAGVASGPRELLLSIGGQTAPQVTISIR